MNNVQIAYYIVLIILVIDILFLVGALHSPYSCWTTKRGIIGFFLYVLLAYLLSGYDKCSITV